MIATETRSTSTMPQRNLLSGGLAIALRGFPALLWTYALSLGAAMLFSARFYGQWDALLSHSLSAQALSSAFDLGTLINGFVRISERVPGGNSPSFGGLIVFSIVSFLLVPGTLFCYAAPAPARLSTLLRAGIQHFWRFVRITLLTAILGGLVLGPLSAINTAVMGKINDHVVGRPSFLLNTVGFLFLFLIATFVRLYFDLVEVYTVQLGLQTSVGPNARADRRIRRTLRPAWQTLTRHFASAWLTFLLLTVLGLAVLALSLRFTIVSLAQPRVWPAFVVMQFGILFDLFTRFWQRGAETVLAGNHPLLDPSAATARPAFAATPALHPSPATYASPEPAHLVEPLPATAIESMPEDPSLREGPPPLS